MKYMLVKRELHRTRGVILGILVGFTAPSEATVARAVPLGELVQSSHWVVVATATSARSHYASVGKGQRVVTDTTVQIDQALTENRSEANIESAVLTVRTLGGTIGAVVHLVYGEAVLAPGTTSLLFLRQGSNGEYRVTGMAQGEYRLVPDDRGEWRLRPSPGLDGILDREQAAVSTLAGRTLAEAERLVSQSCGKARQVR